ncbi:MAG: adenosine kinase [Desulfarculaceae bacterium]|nr:adenosine kinase [Desulfarculaceae bacterium]
MGKTGKTKITGIGSALVDLLINENDAFLESVGKEKGGMTLLEDGAEIERILEKSGRKAEIVPGGAACNTIVGVGMLGGEAGFIGMRGEDGYGVSYEDELSKCNVACRFFLSKEPTGKVLSVITPDAQRSMFTFLGASTGLAPESITPDMFEDTAIAVVEGYLLFNRDLMKAVLRAAKTAGTRIALDLASFEVVEASRDILDDLIKEYVDILIANEDEAEAYTGLKEEDRALEKMAENVEYAVLKIGKRGSMIAHKGTVTRVDPVIAEDAVDTTGAGDLWAAGFLYGLANGFSIEKSGRIGSACGAEVVRVVGAQIPDEGWSRIRKIVA